MKSLVFLFGILFTVGCASVKRPATEAQKGFLREEIRKLEQEAEGYRLADVHAEVERRVVVGDLRFKGWRREFTDPVVFLTGISEEEGRNLDTLQIRDAEVLFIDNLFPIVADEAAYEKRTTALFDYMLRFNRALYERLVTDGKIPKMPNKPVQINAVDARRNLRAVTAISRSPRRV